MKKIISLLILLSLILCGCGGEPVETTAPTTEATEAVTEAPTTVPPTEAPTEPPTEAPTEPPVPTNPLTGETLEAPLDSRIFAVVINNVPAAMPMYGVSKADIFFEMFVNDYATRGLALFSDITEVKSVGSVRSLRYNFLDICQAYDGIVVHAGGSKQVLSALPESGVPNINVGVEYADYYYRDYARLNAGYATEHTLFVKGPELKAYTESKGIRVTGEEGRDYGLHFAEDGTPADGEAASKITVQLNHRGVVKKNVFNFDAETGKYLFNQFNRDMVDTSEGANIAFENVIVLLCNVYNEGVYHIAELEGGGDGFFACNGQIIPIKWIHENETDPFTFTLTDGTPLELGVGNSYIGIAPLASTVEYE